MLLYCIILYNIVLHYIVLLYHIALYFIILYYIVLYYMLFSDYNSIFYVNLLVFLILDGTIFLLL
jgi:hypothetical protein